MRSYIILILVTLAFSSVVKSENKDLGLELSPTILTDGTSFSQLTYAYDSDRLWSFLFLADVSKVDLSIVSEKLNWNIINTTDGKLLQDWGEFNKNELQNYTYDVSFQAQLFTLLPNMKNYVVVISEDKEKYNFHISVKKHCDVFPKKVLDLTNTGNPTCVVEKNQLPDIELECKNEINKLQDWVDQELIPCGLANEKLKEKGCSLLKCE